MAGNRYPRLISDLPAQAAGRAPDSPALVAGPVSLTYEALVTHTEAAASGLVGLGLRSFDRVAIYLHKCVEHAVAMLGTARAGGAFVPINPVLKAPQVNHILRDSGARVLVTSKARLESLAGEVESLEALEHVVLIDDASMLDVHSPANVVAWSSLLETGSALPSRPLETDMAAILYTSGSTGKPKGVVLSHRNVVTGALSVAEYLGNDADDRILSVLPLSFDAGMSQLTTGFASGAQVVMLDYLLAKDVVKACERHQITGITGVPPLWMQLVEQTWPECAAEHLRYFANTGGKMPRGTLDKLRATFTRARPYLMYGLTEAFRSTYLPPSEVDTRPDSIGKAIPNVEILVVRSDGTPCESGEPGELVHRGPLVGMGYWNDPDKTAERFKPAPGQPAGLPISEVAVWSGDTVVADQEGFLYFIGRSDDMIKSSGYRISPTEIEEIAFSTGLVSEAAAIGVPDEQLGQKVILLAKSRDGDEDGVGLLRAFRERAPAYMVPAEVQWHSTLPRNSNGKIDRQSLRNQLCNQS